MMIGSLIMGTTAASGSSSGQFTEVPIPRFVKGKWWSFTKQNSGTAPKYGIISSFSDDEGATWTKANTTFTDDFPLQTLEFTEFGNNIVAGIGTGFSSTTLASKNLSATTNDMVFTDISDIAGGATDTGGGIVNFIDDTNLFVITKTSASIVDIYTSTNCTTFTPINGVTTSDLETVMSNVISIRHSGSEYVAYGFTGGSYSTATSSDLVNWTATGLTVFEFDDVRWFVDRYLAIRDLGGGNIDLYSSTDLKTWTDVTPASFTPAPSTVVYTFKRVISNDNYYIILTDSFSLISTDAINFTVSDLNCSLTDAAFEPKFDDSSTAVTSNAFDIRGDLAIMNRTDVNAESFLMRTVSADQFGGKIMKWSNATDTLPLAVYPDEPTYGDVVAGRGESIDNNGDFADASMQMNDVTYADAIVRNTFYQFNSDKRYFEFKLVALSGTFEIGITTQPNIHTPGGDVFEVVVFEDGDYEEDNSGTTSTAWTPAINDIIGVLLDIPGDELTIKANNTTIYTTTGIALDRQWLPVWLVNGGPVNLNVGQHAFVHPQSGAIPWIDDMNTSRFEYTASPQDIETVLWSFHNQDNSSDVAQIVSLKSDETIPAIVWNRDTIQTDLAGSGATDFYGNGLVGGVNGSFVTTKDVSTDENLWITLNISTISGGFVSGGINLINYDWENSEFIVNKELGKDLYTSTDLVTFTPINGVTENDLNAIIAAERITHNGTEYVAYGTDPLSASGYGTASSADLDSWTRNTEIVERLFDFTYFKNAYYGTFVEGVSAKTDTLAVYRSTDFINWTKMTLPNIVPGTYPADVVVNSGRLSVISHSTVYETTDGTTFTDSTLPFYFPGGALSGRSSLFNDSSSLSDFWFQNINVIQFGGKILRFTDSVASAPALQYPSTKPSGTVVGFMELTNDASENKVSNDGFSVTNDTANKVGFYLNKADIRYFECTVNITESGDAPDPEIGIRVPSNIFESGLNLFSIQLANNFIITSSGNLPVVHTYADGDVIGVLVNFITATVEFFVNGVSLTTVANVSLGVMWTQYISSEDAIVTLNIGQETFEHPQGGSLDWADPYV